MALDPRTTDEIYDSLKGNLQGRISKLTNFVQSTFNYVWTRAFAEEQHDEEVAALAVQMSGWADFAGKEITQDDLDELNIDGATPEELNEYIQSTDLDELAKLVGVSRDGGTRATGELEITTNTATTIPEGSEFGTQPDANGDFLKFQTTEEVSTSSAATVTANIQAVQVGDDYNVGSGTITYMPSPPTGVDSVTNPSGTTGGTNIQSNESLREDIKNAVVESSGGGTKAGVEAYIENNTEAIDVVIQEKFTGDSEHGSYPHGDTIVLGGTDSNVQDAIDESHPSGVEHILIRPDQYGINVSADVEGSNIDTSEVESDISSYFDDLLLGDNIVRDKIIQIIMNADPDIDNIDTLNVEINQETHTYDTGSTNHPYYVLDKGSFMEQDTGITEVVATVGGSSQTLTEGSDYEEYDSANSDYTSPGLNSINFDVDGDGTVDGDNPDNGTDFDVTYRIANDVTINDDEVAVSGNISVTVV